jgi:NADH-quinone oxidoreductase subunit A
MLAISEYSTIAILIVLVAGTAGVTLLLAHLIGPRRHGPIKDSTYESGMTPIADTRRRFNVRFYLVAVMYVVFGVEIIVLWPWAMTFTNLREQLTAHEAAVRAGEAIPVDSGMAWAAAMQGAGYTPGWVLGAFLIFTLLLVVGFIYEWRKGIFRWD